MNATPPTFAKTLAGRPLVAILKDSSRWELVISAVGKTNFKLPRLMLCCADIPSNVEIITKDKNKRLIINKLAKVIYTDF